MLCFLLQFNKRKEKRNKHKEGSILHLFISSSNFPLPPSCLYHMYVDNLFFSYNLNYCIFTILTSHKLKGQLWPVTFCYDVT